MNIEIQKKAKRDPFIKLLLMIPRAVRKEWDTFIAVIWGCAVQAAGVVVLTVPFRFPDAGVTGVASLLYYATGFSIPLFIVIANVAIVAWVWRELSTRVVAWSAFAVLASTLMMKAIEGVPTIETDQILLVALLGGAIKGYGAGVLLRCGVSMGGLDMIILYMRKKYGIEVGKFSLLVNLLIIGVGIWIVGTEKAMLGLAGIYASSVALEGTIASFDKRHQVFVITKDPTPIVRFVIDMLNRSATVAEARGGYTGGDVKLVMSVLSRRQSVELRRFIAANKLPNTIMVVSDATEVVGRGFKSWR